MEEITLNKLLEDGLKIKEDICFVPSTGYRNYEVYKLKNSTEYEIWKNKVIRHLSVQFKEDRCVADFEKSTDVFEKNRYSPTSFDKMIGIINSCIAIPELICPTSENIANSPINISVSQSQSQSQSITIFIEAIQDELTGKQKKEIKAIMQEESDPELAKVKIIDKIKSFGLDVTSNIIANIITNPSIWNLF